MILMGLPLTINYSMRGSAGAPDRRTAAAAFGAAVVEGVGIILILLGLQA
jgi:hypothetical protein